MKYRSCFSSFLIMSSIFYFVCAVLDFTITMNGYYHYGDLFFQMELNPTVCFLLRMGIPPYHMLLIPCSLILLSLYFDHLVSKVNTDFTKIEVVTEKTTWGILFAISLITMMGFLNLLGFVSWFYHGAF